MSDGDYIRRILDDFHTGYRRTFDPVEYHDTLTRIAARLDAMDDLYEKCQGAIAKLPTPQDAEASLRLVIRDVLMRHYVFCDMDSITNDIIAAIVGPVAWAVQQMHEEKAKGGP